MDDRRFWSRVQDALDARRDPREDADVRAWLAACPADAEAFERLEAALAALDRPPAGRGRRRRAAAIAAAALLGALLLAGLRERSEPPVHEAGERSVAGAAGRGRIQSFRIRIATSDGASVREHVAAPAEVAHVRSARLPRAAARIRITGTSPTAEVPRS